MNARNRIAAESGQSADLLPSAGRLSHPATPRNGTPVYNFASGPAMLPLPVLEQAQAQLHNWRGTGISILEIPFTHATFRELIAQTIQDLSDLLAIPDHYQVLLTQGGASAQFSAVPLNLLGESKSADYVHSGYWSAKAYREAKRYGRMRLVGALANGAIRGLSPATEWALDPDAAYCHIVSNETADGITFPDFPECGRVPLVADMSSDIFSRALDISRFGLIYACAQKNLGIAGLTVVIVREDLLGRAHPLTPSVMNYRVLAENGSLFNTPPTFAVYILGLMLEWIKGEGRLPAMEMANRHNSDALYMAIDASGLYHCPVLPPYRSTVNVCFNLPSPELDTLFLSEAEAQGLLNLRGHPACGGVRVGLYNAMPLAGVRSLIEFMRAFESRNASASASPRVKRPARPLG